MKETPIEELERRAREVEAVERRRQAREGRNEPVQEPAPVRR